MLQPEEHPVDRILHRVNDMTARARVYLAIAAARHLLIGSVAIAMPGSFSSAAFLPILRTAPLWMWAALMIGAGSACLVASVAKSEPMARLGMAWSATITVIIGVSLVMAALNRTATPVGPILWLAIALKDFVVCAQPIRSPFEGLTDRMARKAGDSVN
jgi:hypothetical protein